MNGKHVTDAEYTVVSGPLPSTVVFPPWRRRPSPILAVFRAAWHLWSIIVIGGTLIGALYVMFGPRVHIDPATAPSLPVKPLHDK
jgi:hypothetical protein